MTRTRRSCPSIADVLLGKVNPSGKLPYSLPRHSGQLPVYHHQKAGSGYCNPLSPAVMQRYLDMEGHPLWPFGHGLSYSTFALIDLDPGPDIDTEGTAQISATVANTGDRDGAVVVQLYLGQHHGSHPAGPAARRVRGSSWRQRSGAASRSKSTLHNWLTPIAL